MNTEIKYIEIKSGFSDDGPAWIGEVSFSKTGKTIYFDNKAFQSLNGRGIYSNYYDVETGEEYWISNVKKNQQDRSKYGGGKIFVEKNILNDYLKIINRQRLNPQNYEIIEIKKELPVERIFHYLNEKFEEDKRISDDKRFLKPTEMTDEELKYFIEFFRDSSINGIFLKGRKMSRNKMNELIEENESRKTKQKKLSAL